MADHHVHGDLSDQTPGYDQDFDYPHLDDPRIGAEPEEIARITAKLDDPDNKVR